MTAFESVTKPTEQIGRRNPQRPANAKNVNKADIAFASLDAADIGPVQSGFLREILLGELLALSCAPDDVPERPQVLVCHVTLIVGGMTMRLQTMSSSRLT